uniref:Cytochrome b561 domain-containing protein n=1 Tax=Steinernema glaseri TaxID=37863 RepID=A0A1I8ATS8_9BILA
MGGRVVERRYRFHMLVGLTVFVGGAVYVVFEASHSASQHTSLGGLLILQLKNKELQHCDRGRGQESAESSVYRRFEAHQSPFRGLKLTHRGVLTSLILIRTLLYNTSPS